MAYSVTTATTFKHYNPTASAFDGTVVTYWVKAMIELNQLPDISNTAQGLTSFIRMQISDTWHGANLKVAEILVSNRRDVEWLLLKYPNAKYGEYSVA